MSEFYFLAHSVLTACTTRSFDVYRYAMPRVCDDRPRRGLYVHTCFRRINQPHDFRNAFILRWCKEIWRDGEKKKQHLNLRVGFYAWNSLRVFSMNAGVSNNNKVILDLAKMRLLICLIDIVKFFTRLISRRVAKIYNRFCIYRDNCSVQCLSCS